MDRLDAMSLLVSAVEAGSFSAASRKLGVPLPTISRKVSELEARLKTRLLTRSTRRLALTESGMTYLAACRRILEQVTEAEAEASGEFRAPRGELVITAPIAFGRLHVVKVVNAFLANYPEINVRMVLADRTVNLFDDHIDMAVRIGVLPDSSMVATRVGSVRRVVCGSPGFFAAHRMPTTPADLLDLPCVTFSGLPAGTAWTFRAPDRRLVQAVPPNCRLDVNTAEAAVVAATAGVGIAHVLSYQVARAVAERKLVIALEEFEMDPIPVHLVHAAKTLLPLKMRAFLEFAAPRIRKSLAGAGSSAVSEAASPARARRR